MKILVQTTVNQPAAVVFDQIADARNEGEWNTTLSDYRLVSDSPIGKGSTFTYKNRGNEFTSTLSEYNKPNSLRFDVHGKPMDIIANVRFETTSPDITTVHAEYDMMPKGFMKVVMPLMSSMLRKAFEKEFENFKRFSESQR
jgi:hypothetical protein